MSVFPLRAKDSGNKEVTREMSPSRETCTTDGGQLFGDTFLRVKGKVPR